MRRRLCTWFTVLLALEGAAHARRDPVGHLDVQVSVPEAEIIVNGKVLGRSPLAAPLKLMKGTHTIKVTKPGHAEFLDVIKVEVGKTVTLEVDLIPFTAPVEITSSPSGALVFVDGKVVGTTPYRGQIDPGNRSIRVTLDRYLPSERAVELVAGGDYKLEFPLVRAPPPPEELARRSERKPIYRTWWFWTAAGVIVVGTTALLITAMDDDPFGGVDRIINPRW